MTRYLILALVAMASIVSLGVACGGNNPEPPVAPTIDPVAQSVNQTVAAIAVAQTVAALTGPTPTLSQVSTLPPEATQESTEQPTVTTEPAGEQPSPTAGVVTDTPPAETPPSCTTITGINLRSGPGTAYEPPIGTLPGGTTLVPISYVARGFPQGEWLEVQIPNGQMAWVTGGAQFVRCTVELASLPFPAVIPATPRPTATLTPLPATATPTRAVAGLPPNVINEIPGGACNRTANIVAEITNDPSYLYRVKAFDNRVGPNDGDGIDSVRFSISDASGEVYFREERTAGYCIFGGGEPNCRPWPFNDQGQFTWGQGGPVVTPGTYQVFILVVAKEPDSGTESNECNWNFDMTISLP